MTQLSPANPIPPLQRAVDTPDETGKPFGRYRLLHELGRGGMGIVWKAWDTQLNRVVALKQILGEGRGAAQDGAIIERFMREARVAAKLKHPNIVSVYDVGVHDGQHYFTTEYIAGQALDALTKAGRVPTQQALEADKEPARPTLLNPLIHRHVETICLKALNKQPGKRYTTLGDLAADIGRYLAGEHIQARPISGIVRLWRRAVEHRAVIILGGVAGLLAVCLVIVALKLRSGGVSPEGTSDGSTKSPDELRRQTEILLVEAQDMLKTAHQYPLGVQQKLGELKNAIDTARAMLSIQKIALFERRHKEAQDKFEKIVDVGKMQQELDNQLNLLTLELGGATRRKDIEPLAEKASRLIEEARLVFSPDKLSRFEQAKRIAWLRVIQASRLDADQIVNGSTAETAARLEAYRNAKALLGGLRDRLSENLPESNEEITNIELSLAEFQKNIDYLDARQACEDIDFTVQIWCAQDNFIEAFDACAQDVEHDRDTRSRRQHHGHNEWKAVPSSVRAERQLPQRANNLRPVPRRRSADQEPQAQAAA